MDLQTSELTEQLSALAVFILSHGEDNGTIFAQDSMYRVDHDILFQLTADKCQYLAGKPKLIFVQACQGQVTIVHIYYVLYLKRKKEKTQRNTYQASEKVFLISRVVSCSLSLYISLFFHISQLGNLQPFR